MFLGITGIARAIEDGETECSSATLRGLYQFAASGYTIVGGAAQPKAVAASWLFDGHGALASVGAASINGTIARPPAGTGTYAVGSDCRGTLNDPAGFTFDLFLSPKGTEFFMIQTTSNTVFAARVTKTNEVDSARVVWIQPGSLAGFGGSGNLVIAGYAGGAVSPGAGVTLYWRDVTADTGFTALAYAPLPDPKGVWFNAIPNANFTHQYAVYVTYGDASSTTCTYAGNGLFNSCP